MLLYRRKSRSKKIRRRRRAVGTRKRRGGAPTAPASSPASSTAASPAAASLGAVDAAGPAVTRRSWAMRAALHNLARTPGADSGAVGDEEFAAHMQRVKDSKKSVVANPSLGKRAAKTSRMKEARRENQGKIQKGMNVENAMIYGAIQEEMNNATARRLFGNDSPWEKKAAIENDLIDSMSKGHYWMVVLKKLGSERAHGLTPERAQLIQDYYLKLLTKMGSDREEGASRGGNGCGRHTKRKKRGRKRRKRRKKRTRRRRK